jgi:hypothetical protein
MVMPLCTGLLTAVLVPVFWTPGSFLFPLNCQSGNALEIGAHAGHEAGIMGRPVAWMGESCEESCRHVERLEIILYLGVAGVADDV